MREEIPVLADGMASANKAMAKLAKAYMAETVHDAARPDAPKAYRKQTIAYLLAVIRSRRPRLVRAHALRLLGLIGGKPEEKLLAPLEADREVGEDARMARERLRRSA